MNEHTNHSERPNIVPLMNTDEAARALGISRRSLQLYVAKSMVSYIKLGGSIRFSQKHLLEFIERCTTKAVGWHRSKHEGGLLK